MCCGCDLEVPFEGFKVPFILQNGVVRHFSFDTLLKVEELLGDLLLFRPGVLLGISFTSTPIGEFGLLTGLLKSPLHKLFPGDELKFF